MGKTDWHQCSQQVREVELRLDLEVLVMPQAEAAMKQQVLRYHNLASVLGGSFLGRSIVVEGPPQQT